MYKKILKISSLVFCFLLIIEKNAFAVSLQTEDHKKTKIVVIDVAYIAQNSQAMTKAKIQLDKMLLHIQKVNSDYREKFEKEYKRLQEQKNIMQSSDYDEEVVKFEDEVKNVEKELLEKRQKLDKLLVEVYNILNKNIRSIIHDIIKENKDISYIALDKSSVYYSGNEHDISNIVLEELNKKFKDIDIKKIN